MLMETLVEHFKVYKCQVMKETALWHLLIGIEVSDTTSGGALDK